MLIPDLVNRSAGSTPTAIALRYRESAMTYATLAQQIADVGAGLRGLGLNPGQRVAVYMEKRPEAVVGLLGAAWAGGAFVPVNPILKPAQVVHILRDCNVRLLITTRARLEALSESLQDCPDLRSVIVVDGGADTGNADTVPPQLAWEALLSAPAAKPHRRIDSDMAAILYTSGSTGRPKGVVLSHSNMVTGALSVAQYLENTAQDRLLAALPLSFDYGFSQLSTAFSVGAEAVLLNHLLPRDVLRAVVKHRITGLAAVPPLWIQLAELDWPEGIDAHLRYMTNTGGAMPADTLARLRKSAPRSRFFLMYGLTEAFRSTYLPPEEIARRPGSMGKAIPNADILVVRSDGTPCDANEPGELVHRGPLVGMGYWNDRERTAERYRPAPGQPPELPIPEMAVWSGDTVRRDEDGYLYFVGRRDEMIKTSGYRVSPTEVEEIAYQSELVRESAAVGVPHPALGQGILLVALPRDQTYGDEALLQHFRRQAPGYMVPARIVWVSEALPRNANGKIDRKSLQTTYANSFEGAAPQ